MAASKSSNPQAPKVKKAQKVLKLAVKKTKEDLQKKQIVKKVITYPKGLWKETLDKNYEKAAKDAGLQLKPKRVRLKAAAEKAEKKTSKKRGGKKK